jgi:hypothetical protein
MCDLTPGTKNGGRSMLEEDSLKVQNVHLFGTVQVVS